MVRGNAQFIFLCNPQKSSANVCLMNILKSNVAKKVIVLLALLKKTFKSKHFLYF